MSFLKSETVFIFCKIAGFGLLFAYWLESGEIAGFFLLLSLIILSLLRWRFPKLWFTFAADGVALWLWGYYTVLAIFLVSEVFYGVCRFERKRGLELRDLQAGKYYEQVELQNDLASALAQTERMTAVAERARIAREIHDNAGHEIVAAYISLQTARGMLESEKPDGENPDGEVFDGKQYAQALELYDSALERLSGGVDKIREAVHNLSTVSLLGVENLRETCRRFPACPVEFHSYGDCSKVPVFIWNMLDACLNESLTNVMRHSEASRVSVDLDITMHIVRLCIENDGVGDSYAVSGTGLHNLKHRAAAIGGSLSVSAASDVFTVICVIPLQGEPM